MSELRAEGLAKRFKQRAVVSQVSLAVSSGEVVGLLGPGGAGKTTSFYMIVGLIQADAGRVWLDERDITTLPMHARARLGLGYMPQESSVFRKLSVRDNVLAVLETRADLNRSERRQTANDIMASLRIDRLRDQPGLSLSGGERRRVEVARALAANPRFVLLDEPFAGVDPISISDIQQLIQNLSRRDIGVLITDHNVRETLKICDRAYIISEGQLIAAGTPAEIVVHPQVRARYLGESFTL